MNFALEEPLTRDDIVGRVIETNASDVESAVAIAASEGRAWSAVPAVEGHRRGVLEDRLVVSTTVVPTGKRAVPIAFIGMYHMAKQLTDGGATPVAIALG